MEPYFRPLLYLKSAVFAYYELLLEDGDHAKILPIFGNDEKAVFLYLKTVSFWNCVSGSSAFPPSSPRFCSNPRFCTRCCRKAGNRCATTCCFALAGWCFARTGGFCFASSNPTNCSGFLNISLQPRSPKIATFLLAALNERIPAEPGEEVVEGLCRALLQHLEGDSRGALAEVNGSFVAVTERLQGELRNLFNVKDLEVFLIVEFQK